mgnify:CR=1 FL=1
MDDGATATILNVALALGVAAVGYLVVSATSSSKSAKSAPKSRKNIREGQITLGNADFGGTNGLSAEVSRDFSRYFTSGHAVFLVAPLNWDTQGASNALRQLSSNVPNNEFTAESNGATIAHFRERVRAAMEQVRTRVSSPSELLSDRLLTLIIRCMTVNFGFEIAFGVVKCPSLLQPSFVLALSETQCHVVSYAYVGSNARGTVGRKYTDQVLRIQSPELRQLADSGETECRCNYQIFSASHQIIKDEIQSDLQQSLGSLDLPKAN